MKFCSICQKELIKVKKPLYGQRYDLSEVKKEYEVRYLVEIKECPDHPHQREDKEVMVCKESLLDSMGAMLEINDWVDNYSEGNYVAPYLLFVDGHIQEKYKEFIEIKLIEDKEE